MQKVRLISSFALALALASPASAADKAPDAQKLNQLQIFYQQNPDQEGSSQAILEWDVSKKICHAKYQSSGKASWIKMTPQKCRKIQTFITENWNELQKRSELGLTAIGRAHLQGPHIPLAEIQFSNIKLGVLAHQVETCDVTMSHCERRSKDPADQLGYLVLSVLTEAFE